MHIYIFIKLKVKASPKVWQFFNESLTEGPQDKVIFISEK